jgi:hypothetical protein
VGKYPNINSIYAEKHIQFNYAIAVDMFPPTVSAKNAVYMLPRTDSSKNIHSVLSIQVEVVVLIERQ